MEDIKEKIKNKGYRNWVKCTLGLEQTKKGVHNYVLEKFKSYTERRSKMHPNDMLSESDVDHMNGTEYIRHSLRQSLQYTGKKWRWRIETYPCHDCESAFGKILSLHTKGIGFKDIWWENSDNTTKISLEWAIAKMFMPQGNENNTCPEDTDPAALFHLMLMCKLFNNCPHPNKVNKLKEIRNTLFHSSTNTVSDDDAHEYFEVMVTFLQEASYDQDIVAGVKNEIDESSKKIDTLKTSDITMTLIQDAENALQIKRKALYYDFDEQLCKNDPEKLREILKLAEQLGGDIELLKKHIQDMKGAEKYEAENEQLRKERDKLCDGIKVTSVNMQTVKRTCEELCCDARGRTDEISKSLVQVKEEIEKRIHISSQNYQKDQKTIEEQRVEIQNLSKRNEDLQEGVRNVSRLTQTLKYELGQTNIEIRNKLCETSKTIIQNREKIFTRHLEDTKRIENYKIFNQAMCKEREQLRRGITKTSMELTELRESYQQIVIDIRQDVTRTTQEIKENIKNIFQRHTEDTVIIESQKLKIAELEGNISDMREGIFTILQNVNRLRKSHAEVKVAFQTTSAKYTEWIKEANEAIIEECRRMCRHVDRVRDVAKDVSLRSNELRQLLEKLPFVRNEAHGTYDNTVELRNALHLRIPQNIGDQMMVWVLIAAIVVGVILKVWELWG